MLSAEISDSGHDADGFFLGGSNEWESGCVRETSDCWEDLAEVKEGSAAETAAAEVVLVEAEAEEGWGDPWATSLDLQDLVEKRCLMKVQEEERALWVLNLGWEGEGCCCCCWECETGETLRFFEGLRVSWRASSPAVVEEMKQPRWRRRTKRERNL